MIVQLSREGLRYNFNICVEIFLLSDCVTAIAVVIAGVDDCCCDRRIITGSFP